MYEYEGNQGLMSNVDARLKECDSNHDNCNSATITCCCFGATGADMLDFK